MIRGLAILLLTGMLFSFYQPGFSQVPVKRPKSTNYVIDNVTVQGNQYFSKKEIQDQTSFARPSWWQFPSSFFALFSRPRLNAKLVPTDEFAIDSLYHVSGFWDAKSKISWEMTGQNNVKVLIAIAEGVRTYLSEKKVSDGFPDFNAKASGALDKLELNQAFDRTKLDLAAFELKKVYADKGYPYAEVEPHIAQTADKTKASVDLAVIPGEVVHFGKTEIKGLGITKEHVVRRELAYREGDLYSREKLIETKQRIYSSGLFSFVTLDARDADKKPIKPDFSLTVVERKPKYVKFGFSAGQSQQQDLTGDFSGEFGNRNLFGTGRKYSLSATSSFVLLSRLRYLSSQFNLNYSQPWVAGLRIPLDIVTYYTPGAKSVNQPYRIEQFGGDLNLRQELRKKTRLWVTGSYQQINIYGIPEAEQAVFRREKGISIRRKIGFSVENDTRGNVFVPVGGSLTQVSADFFGGILGGDHNFSKIVLSWSRYFQSKASPKLETWAFRIKVGRAFEYRLQDFVPSLDRFYLGGASSIRGYTENSLGPKDDSTGVPIGGKIVGLVNVEYRRGLFGKLGWTLFLDYGDVWLDTKDVSLSTVRLSGGVGLQYFSPLGPIRLDYGRKLMRGRNGLNGGRLHLSILYAF